MPFHKGSPEDGPSSHIVGHGTSAGYEKDVDSLENPEGWSLLASCLCTEVIQELSYSKTSGLCLCILCSGLPCLWLAPKRLGKAADGSDSPTGLLTLQVLQCLGN